MSPQPEYVPVRAVDEVRPVERLPAPKGWKPDRPGDLRSPDRPTGPGLGTPGPDQGYALRLARQFHGKLRLGDAEHEEDAIAGCLGVALRRASLFDRAPVIHDLELAFSVWGFLGDTPSDLVEFRQPLFQGAAHHYWDKRVIADAVSEETLRLTPAQARERLADWRSLLVM
ncbi:MAG TPA: hypothetical protein VFA11_09850 [Acidimicrobiales bacterium]|nr:hypothetical protein [Acidimicrobiales bacterium]